MKDTILNHESEIRLGLAVFVMLLIAVWELMAPAQPLRMRRQVRWINNLGLALMNMLMLRWIFPLAAVSSALWAQSHEFGLFNQLKINDLTALVAAIVLLDLAIWSQHVMMHTWPWLWRLHRVHHADPDFDFTTGSRFHPLEMLFSMILKMTTVALIGAPVLAVVIFEIILNASAVFNHGNIHLHPSIETLLRRLIVTPAMHRVHHSQNPRETNSNYGFFLSIWDHLFSTHHASPKQSMQIQIGIREHQEASQVCHILGMLALPFVSAPSKPLHSVDAEVCNDHSPHKKLPHE